MWLAPAKRRPVASVTRQPRVDRLPDRGPHARPDLLAGVEQRAVDVQRDHANRLHRAILRSRLDRAQLALEVGQPLEPAELVRRDRARLPVDAQERRAQRAAELARPGAGSPGRGRAGGRRSRRATTRPGSGRRRSSSRCSGRKSPWQSAIVAARGRPGRSAAAASTRSSRPSGARPVGQGRRGARRPRLARPGARSRRAGRPGPGRAPPAPRAGRAAARRRRSSRPRSSRRPGTARSARPSARRRRPAGRSRARAPRAWPGRRRRRARAASQAACAPSSSRQRKRKRHRPGPTASSRSTSGSRGAAELARDRVAQVGGQVGWGRPSVGL